MVNGNYSQKARCAYSNDVQPPIDLFALSHAQKDALIIHLFEQVAALTKTVTILTNRVDEL